MFFFYFLLNLEEPSGVDQVFCELLRNLTCESNSRVFFVHHFIEADICRIFLDRNWPLTLFT